MPIEVKLMVDKGKQKVVFAECGTDFVDVLCSFLTLPLGIIVKLLNKHSGLGCMDKLYKSVKDLDADKDLQTPLCKTMLLQPRSIAAEKCEGLAVNICDDLKLNPERIFWCPKWECACKSFPYYSSVSGVKCSCDKPMDRILLWPKTVANDGVFLKESVERFLVGDNLQICVASSVTVALPFFIHHGVDDLMDLEERKILVDKTQILALLKASLVSKTPLTDAFLGKPVNNATVRIKTESDYASTKIKTGSDFASPKRKRETYNDHGSVVTTVKILKSNNVKLVEAGNDFVDQVFSFLTFPLGQVLSLLGKGCSTLGCIHNLYTSIDNKIVDDNRDILPAENKEMLLRKKLPPYSGCSNRLLEVDEIQPRTYYVRVCKGCWESKLTVPTCLHTKDNVRHTELNAKLVMAAPKDGGGFATTNARFIVTDDMTVKPNSVISTWLMLKDLGASVDSFKERTVTVEKTKALKFLEACLTSSTGIIDSLLD